MDWTSYWVQLVINIPFLFFMYWTYRIGLAKGYKRGARKVLEEWKAVINYVDDNVDVNNIESVDITVQGRNQK